MLMERGERSLFPSYRESEGRGLESDAVVSDLREVLVRVNEGGSAEKLHRRISRR